MTNDKLPAMSIIAVTQEKDDWAMIAGESKKRSGWIKKALVSGIAEDVADAIFASRKLKQDDKMTYAEKVNYIAANAPFPASPIIERLKQAAAAGQPAPAAAAAPADSASPAKAPGADSAAAAPAAK